MRQTLLKASMIDTWYKQIIPVGFGLFLFTIYLEFGFISSGVLSFFAVGLILVGLGELVNHKNISPHTLIGSMHPETKIRKPEEIGLLLDAIGLFCFAFGFYVILSISI
jgi:hypothetical protein